jgi:site-specific DNA-adenine methylase
MSTAGLKPVFSFFGSKWRAALRYPAPLHDTIIEPFAGGAGYALRYHTRRVILVEKDPKLHGAWMYLQRASASEILALPDLACGQSVDDLTVPQEAKWLIGMWLNSGAARPCKTPSAWMNLELRDPKFGSPSRCQFWGAGIRARLAAQREQIQHWRLVLGDYTAAPDTEATWFIDPPYQLMGRHYDCGSDQINYFSLAAWCRSRRGQVMVCENVGADWLPFRPHHAHDKTRISKRPQCRKNSAEAIWP